MLNLVGFVILRNMIMMQSLTMCLLCFLHRSCQPSDLTIRMILVIFTLFGFIIFDLDYIATVMNYCCQCHLLNCLVLDLKERILMKAVAVDEAIKVMTMVKGKVLSQTL